MKFCSAVCLDLALVDKDTVNAADYADLLAHKLSANLPDTDVLAYIDNDEPGATERNSAEAKDFSVMVQIVSVWRNSRKKENCMEEDAPAETDASTPEAEIAAGLLNADFAPGETPEADNEAGLLNADVAPEEETSTADAFGSETVSTPAETPADAQAAPAKTKTEKTVKKETKEVPTEPLYCTVLKMKGTDGIFLGAESATEKDAYKNLCVAREELRAKYAAENAGITLNGGWDTGYVLIDGLGCKVGELYIGGLKDLTKGLLPAGELMWHPGSVNSLVHPARIHKGALTTAKSLVQAAWATYNETPNEANRNALNARMVHLETVMADGEDACHFTPFVGKNADRCAPGCRKEVTPAVSSVQSVETPAETPQDAPAETPEPSETPSFQNEG